MNFRKISALFLAALLIATPLYAAFSVQEDGTQEGIVDKLNVSTGLDNSVSGKTTTVTLSQTESHVSTMFKITATASTARPASGATAGTIVAINDSNAASNCGAAGSGGSAFVVCYSDGTNWKILNN